MRPRLLLFDIDGTLIRDDGAAREAYTLALEHIYGFSSTLAGYDFSGKTDPQITHWVLGDAGFSREEVEARLPDFWDLYLAGLAERVDRHRIEVIDGVEALLDQLQDDDRFVIALLTGNIEPGARIKLSPHRLYERFRFGAFGSDSEHRENLPPIAVERARQHTSTDFDPRDVVIIGDSIWDVRCGVPHEATTIAVSTGRTPAELLRAENPDHFFESLHPTSELLDAIHGQGSATSSHLRR